MSRACSICRLSTAGSINGELRAPDSNVRQIAARHEVSYAALWRHSKHLPAIAAPPSPTTARTPAPPAAPPPVDALDELVAALRKRALAGNPSDTREYRLALAAQTDRSMGKTEPYDVDHDPGWTELRTLLFRTLKPYPDAWSAMRDALEARELKRSEASQ